MKILCFTQFYIPDIGGMQISNSLIVEGLKKKKVEIELHLFGNSRKIIVNENLTINNHKFIPLSFFGHLRTLLLVISSIKKVKPDLILFLDESITRSLGMTPLKLNFNCKIFSINSGSTLTRRNLHFKGKLNAFFIKRGYEYIDKLFLSESTKNDLLKNHSYLESKINVLGRPISNNFYLKEEKFLNWKSNEKIPVLMSVGGLWKHKGFDLIIKSLALMKKKYGCEKCEYIIIGDGPEKKFLSDLIKKHKLLKVKILGYKPNSDLPSYISQSDIFVIPSINEGETFGRSCVEAMACSKPILSSYLSNLSNLVKEGENGFVVKPNIKNFYFAIERFLNISRSRYIKMSKSSYKIAIKYKQENIVNQLIKQFPK
ncbi:glycosyltransferase family 4 protein [Prochlorococcus marinus]|uniref:glycosyltransferase family 4 protein n=1 Tax=Prochlorococcus marinus TaxID=1219 RepID=UPI001ADC41AB|nr:glycosyltransferase family 4 protein [Prochlorococcus marinus]MBO8204958.1 glycosyltransferase family 4 protein [Prochlorococcus marinus CUG1415]MBW3044230.1 hypothetical protein [Prochlorococcus marinus str. MU1415]